MAFGQRYTADEMDKVGKDGDMKKCQDDAAKKQTDAGTDPSKMCKAVQENLDCLKDCCGVKYKIKDVDGDQKVDDMTKSATEMMKEGCKDDDEVKDPCA